MQDRPPAELDRIVAELASGADETLADVGPRQRSRTRAAREVQERDGLQWLLACIIPATFGLGLMLAALTAGHWTTAVGMAVAVMAVGLLLEARMLAVARSLRWAAKWDRRDAHATLNEYVRVMQGGEAALCTLRERGWELRATVRDDGGWNVALVHDEVARVLVEPDGSISARGYNLMNLDRHVTFMLEDDDGKAQEPSPEGDRQG